MAKKNTLTVSLDPDFATAAVHRLVVDPHFFALYGSHMDADLCSEESVKWAVKAAQAIFRDTRSAPNGEFAVMQRLQSWVDEGVCPAEMLEAVEDDFDYVGESLQKLTPAVLGSELGNALKRHKRHLLVEEIITAHGRGEDLSRQAKALMQVDRIGHVRDVQPVGLKDARSLLTRASQMERLPTGIEELDESMKGGVPRQSLTLWIGGTGDGKSIALSMSTAVALIMQRNALYVSLEIPEYMVLSRIAAALTGFTIDDFEEVDNEALAALDAAMSQGGSLNIKYMEPNHTTPNDLQKLIDQVEQESGEAVEFLAVDYLDRLAAPGKRGKGRNELSTYATGEIVTTMLRDEITLPRNLWTHTASAAKGQSGGKKSVKGTDDGADSMHKSRISDNVITLNVTEVAGGERQMLLKLAKHRTGSAGMTVGPFPTDFAVGSLVRNRVLEGDEDDQTWSSVF